MEIDNRIVVEPFLQVMHVRYDSTGFDELDFHAAVGHVVTELKAWTENGSSTFSSVNDTGHAIDVVFCDELSLREAIIWNNRINQMIKTWASRLENRKRVEARLG